MSYSPFLQFMMREARTNMPLPGMHPNLGDDRDREMMQRKLDDLGALALFYDQSDENESHFGRIMERGLHKHHVQLAAKTGRSLHSLMIGLVLSFQMSDAFSELAIRHSYLMPDRDQMYWVPVRTDAKLGFVMEFFILQTNPQLRMRPKVPMGVMKALKKQLGRDGFMHLYEQFSTNEDSKIVTVDIGWPDAASYTIRNKVNENPVVQKNPRSPLTSYAIMTELETTKHEFTSHKFYRIMLGTTTKSDRFISIGQSLITAGDFEPKWVTNELGESTESLQFLDRLKDVLQENHEKLRLDLDADTLTRVIQGFSIGVDVKYGLDVVSTADFDRPNFIGDVTFMKHSTLGDFTYNDVPTLISVVDNEPLIRSLKEEDKHQETTNVAADKSSGQKSEKSVHLPIDFDTESDHYKVVRVKMPGNREGGTIDYKVETYPTFNRLTLTAPLFDASFGLKDVLKIICEGVKKSLNYFGTNTFKHLALGMVLTEYSPCLREQLLTVNYVDRSIGNQLFTLILQARKTAHVINIVDHFDDTISVRSKTQPDLVGRSEWERWGIEKIQTHNIELKINMAPTSSKEIDVTQDPQYRVVPKDYLRSLTNTGEFPGMIYSTRNPILVSTIANLQTGGTIRPINPFFTYDDIKFLGKQAMSFITSILFHTITPGTLRVDYDRQAAAIFQTATAQHCRVYKTQINDPTVSGIHKPIYVAHHLRSLDIHAPFYHKIFFSNTPYLVGQFRQFTNHVQQANGNRAPAVVELTRFAHDAAGRMWLSHCAAPPLAAYRPLLPENVRPPVVDAGGREPAEVPDFEFDLLLQARREQALE